MVSSNPCVGSALRTNISFFFLSACTDELLSTPKIMTFLPQSEPGYEKMNQNQIQYHIQNKNIYQHPSNTKQKFELLYHSIVGERLLSAVIG